MSSSNLEYKVKNNEEINIIDLISQLDNLGKEKDKNDFIKNYTVLKDKIEKTDNILDQNDENENTYNLYNIQELFDILESNSEFVSNPEKLDVSKLKMLLKISKILEDKLGTETMNIIESK